MYIEGVVMYRVEGYGVYEGYIHREKKVCGLLEGRCDEEGKGEGVMERGKGEV